MSIKPTPSLGGILKFGLAEDGSQKLNFFYSKLYRNKQLFARRELNLTINFSCYNFANLGNVLLLKVPEVGHGNHDKRI